MTRLRFPITGAAALTILCNCASTKPRGDALVISVSDQRLVVFDDGAPVKSYPISTSKFGLGSKSRSNKTPLGKMYVHQKVGGGARPGTVFKSRRPTGEVIKPNTPGRDPIVSRILWLEGRERSNANTKERMIYIHGTPEERTIGRPASYGCIRMKSKDVIDLYDRIPTGANVYVKRSHLRVAEIPNSDRVLVASASRREARRPIGPAPRVEVVAAASSAGRTPPPWIKEHGPTAGTIPPVRRSVPSVKVRQSLPPSRPVPPAPTEQPKRRGAFSKI